MMAGMDLGSMPGQRSTQAPAMRPPVSPALYPAAQPQASLEKSNTATPGVTGTVAVNPALTPTKLTAPTVPPPRQLTPEQQAMVPAAAPTSLTVDLSQGGGPVDFHNGPAMTTSPVTPHDRPMPMPPPQIPQAFLPVSTPDDVQRNAMAAAVQQFSAAPPAPASSPQMSAPVPPAAPVVQAPVVQAPTASPAIAPAPVDGATTQPVQPVRQAPQIGAHPIQHLLRRYRQGTGGPVIGGRRFSGML